MNHSSYMQHPTSNLFEECEQYLSLGRPKCNRESSAALLISASIHSTNFTCKCHCKFCISIDWFSLQPHILKICTLDQISIYIQMHMKSLPLKGFKATDPSNRVSCNSALPRK